MADCIALRTKGSAHGATKADPSAPQPVSPILRASLVLAAKSASGRFEESEESVSRGIRVKESVSKPL